MWKYAVFGFLNLILASRSLLAGFRKSNFWFHHLWHHAVSCLSWIGHFLGTCQTGKLENICQKNMVFNDPFLVIRSEKWDTTEVESTWNHSPHTCSSKWWHLAAKNTLEKTVFKAVKPPQSVSRVALRLHKFSASHLKRLFSTGCAVIHPLVLFVALMIKCSITRGNNISSYGEVISIDVRRPVC